MATAVAVTPVAIQEETRVAILEVIQAETLEETPAVELKAGIPVEAPEETPEDRREKYRTAAGVGNIFGIVAGVVVILLLVALLLRMGHFVEEDMTRNFALFQTNF